MWFERFEERYDFGEGSRGHEPCWCRTGKRWRVACHCVPSPVSLHVHSAWACLLKSFLSPASSPSSTPPPPLRQSRCCSLGFHGPIFDKCAQLPVPPLPPPSPSLPDHIFTSSRHHLFYPVRPDRPKFRWILETCAHHVCQSNSPAWFFILFHWKEA